ncbi:hypothetical protein PTKIN_Ptkin16aG0503200 [Pterospermum kingtungense]
MLRRIAIHPTKRYVCLKGVHKKLRSLLLFQDEKLIELDISKCKSFKHLRVLKVVRGYATEWCVTSAIGNLHHLRYLRLECDNGEVMLPRSIGKLKGLLTLNVEGIIFKRSKDVEPILKALIEWQRLRSLEMEIWKDSDQSFPDLEPLSQCDHLLELELSGQLREEDPHSSHHHVLKFVPANIVKLTLRRSKLMQDPMAVLEKLPHLRFLALWTESYKGTKLICSANGFLQLDFLQIRHLSELEEWEIEEGAMRRLRFLMLSGMLNLKMFPEGMRYLTALQEMVLHKMRTSLIERIEVKDGRDGDDFSKVSHIPSIQVIIGTEED